MIVTHTSHFGLNIDSRTEDSVVLSGTKANCLRMAAVLGLEIERYEGRTLSLINGVGFSESADRSNFTWCYFRQGGFIHRGRDEYSLVVRMADWIAA